MDFNFEEWAQLFKDDPEAFEKKKREVLEETLQGFIERGSSKLYVESLRAGLWRQEHELKKFKDPQARLNKVIELFYEQHDKFNDALEEYRTKK